MEFDDLSLCCAHICSIFRFGFSAKGMECRYPARIRTSFETKHMENQQYVRK